MAETKKDVLYKKKYLETIGKLILNNDKLSDVSFVVNKKQYYASRIHVSAASQVFASLLNEHFANTTDKELVLRNIKHNASFFNILQYIHGIELNLTTMSKLVLCELTHLAERFKLAELHEDLKAHVSNIKRFKMNSIVAMLNTARTYNLTKLYEKLLDYVYQHAEQVVNHKTFVDLKYDVMVDLLKSNWLYAKEIDILRAALNWHDDNIIDPAKITKRRLIMDEFDLNSEDIASEDDAWSEIDIVEEFLGKYSEELFDNESKTDLGFAGSSNKDNLAQCESIDQVGNELCKIDDSHSKAVSNPVEKVDDSGKSHDVSDETKPEINELDQQLDKEKSVVELFSKNILNTLVEHIRFSRLTMLDSVTIADEEPFKKYRDSILSKLSKDFANINEDPRHLYKEVKNHVSVLLFTITDIKELKESSSTTTVYSEENHFIKRFEWSIGVKNEKEPGIDNTHFGLYLNCNSERKEWKVEVSFQLTLLTHKLGGTNISQKENSYTYENTELPGWGWPKFVNISTLFDPNKGFIQNDSITVEVLLKINSY